MEEEPTLQECPHCYWRTWSDTFSLDSHIQAKHPINFFIEYTCKFCQLVFESSGSLLYHYEIVHEDEYGHWVEFEGEVVVDEDEGCVGSTSELLPELVRQPIPFREKFAEYLYQVDWGSRAPFVSGPQPDFPPANVDTSRRYPQPLLRFGVNKFPRPTLHLIESTKTVHLIRAAQALHNSAGESDHNQYLSGKFFDYGLTEIGYNQVQGLRAEIRKKGLNERIKLVVLSPLLRALQTAVGLFRGKGCPHLLAIELCREQMGVYPCDCRRSLLEYKNQFLDVEFRLSQEDMLWDADIREPDEEVALRGKLFIDWLFTQEENEIAVVTHGNFLYHVLSQFADDCDDNIKYVVRKNFGHCEIRSVVIADRRKRGI